VNGLLETVRHPTVETVKKIFGFQLNRMPPSVADECRGLGAWLDSDSFWKALDEQLTARDIEKRETERFVKKLLRLSENFSESGVAPRITHRCENFLRRVLPAAKQRINERQAKLEETIKRIKASIGAGEPAQND
jgi:hypothetical protein